MAVLEAVRGQRKDDARMKFASWLAMPQSQRQPATQEQLAKQLGVANSTLSEWRHLPMIQAVVAGWRESYKSQFSEVVEALFRYARRGSVPHARLLADILGEIAPTRRIYAHGVLTPESLEGAVLGEVD